MRKERQRVEELRKKGLSYKQISKKTGVPVGTLAGWLKNLPWSIELRDRLSQQSSFSSPKKIELISKANKERWAKWHEEYRKEAIEEYSDLNKDTLFQAGLLLYWGEGNKKLENGTVRLSNIDPQMIKIFYKFLYKKIGVPEDKIHASLLLYPDLIDAVSKNYWSKSTGIPLTQFKKSIYIVGRHPKKRLSFGVCTIHVNSRKIKEKIIKWLDLYKNELIGNNI